MAGCVATGGRGGGHGGRFRVCRVGRERMVDVNRRAFEQSGLELAIGTGRFVAPRTIAVRAVDGPKRSEGENVYINTGTVASFPDVPGCATRSLTHVEALRLTTLPGHLVVIGGGYIGLEMAQAFRRLGSAVTLVSDTPRVAMREDEDVSTVIQQALTDDGIRLELAARLVDVQGKSGERVTVRLADGRAIEGSHVLVATGARRRRPASAGSPASRRTSAVHQGRPSARDDCGTHVGDRRGRGHADVHACVVRRLPRAESRYRRPAGEHRRPIPYALFIDPELGRIGLNEADANARKIDVRVAKLPMASVPRARTDGNTRGFMKALVHPGTGAILGFTMVGTGAGDVTTAVQMAMLGGLPYTAVRDAIIGHPIISEGLNLLFATLR